MYVSKIIGLVLIDSATAIYKGRCIHISRPATKKNCAYEVQFQFAGLY